MRLIKLMPDYHCWPLWEASPGKVGNINPETLPLSGKLKERLAKWSQTFDSILHDDDPASSGFRTLSDAVAFNIEGYELAKLLQEELDSDYILLTQMPKPRGWYS